MRPRWLQLLAMAPDYKLTPHAHIAPPEGPVLVCIADGLGEGLHADEFNASLQAHTPCLDALRKSRLWRCVGGLSALSPAVPKALASRPPLKPLSPPAARVGLRD